MCCGSGDTHRIVINVPAAEVWKILTSFKYDFSDNISYAKWEGDYKLIGTKGVYKLKIKEGAYKEPPVEIIAYTEGKEIGWGIKKLGGCMVSAARTLTITPVNETSCELSHTLAVSGMMSVILPVNDLFERAHEFDAELKKFAESNSGK